MISDQVSATPSQPLYLTDAEVDDICAGLKQNAAKVRFLQRLGYHVERKPNGRPLVRRPQQPTNGFPFSVPKWTKPA